MDHTESVLVASNEELGEIGTVEQISVPTIRFSFVWFNFLIIFACMVFWAIFVFAVTSRQNRRIIRYYHDTISSFCASSDSWENRFLLTFTLLISMNLLCMHTEEFNSRPDDGNRNVWLFLLECSAAACFPLVGICYTEGKVIVREAFNRKLSLHTYEREQEQKKKASMLTIMVPSSDADLGLQLVQGGIGESTDSSEQRQQPLLVRSSINLDDSLGVAENSNCDDPATSVTASERFSEDFTYFSTRNSHLRCGRCQIPISFSQMVHSVAALYFLFGFTFCNVYYVLHLWSSHPHTPLVKFMLFMAICNFTALFIFITIQGMIEKRCNCFCKMKVLRTTSFVFEGLSGFFVIMLAVLASMKRNNGISWFK